MEIDTGESVSIMCEKSFELLRDRGTVLSQSHAKLFTYTGQPIPVVHVGAVDVHGQNTMAKRSCSHS